MTTVARIVTGQIGQHAERREQEDQMDRCCSRGASGPIDAFLGAISFSPYCFKRESASACVKPSNRDSSSRRTVSVLARAFSSSSSETWATLSPALLPGAVLDSWWSLANPFTTLLSSSSGRRTDIEPSQRSPNKPGVLPSSLSLMPGLHLADGLAAVRIGDERTGKWGHIDKQGKMVVNPQFDSAEPFAKGLQR